MAVFPTAKRFRSRIDFSAGVAWFGDILIEGPLMEIGPRSVFANHCAGARLPDGP